ncbi:hypothetical protein ACE193_21310 [Bernardetia sp. OM2101]|uniref:hypothetical protein n=1 Tax=Bernardetia sp. OM2101 TaxID=3344876 RepID=UPI0035D0B765
MKHHQNQNKITRWVLIRHYWKAMNRWFPVWVSYQEMNENSFSPATAFEKERFGCCIKTNQIMAYEEEVSDRSTGFQVAYLVLEKEAKKEQKESLLS